MPGLDRQPANRATPLLFWRRCSGVGQDRGGTATLEPVLGPVGSQRDPLFLLLLFFFFCGHWARASSCTNGRDAMFCAKKRGGGAFGSNHGGGLVKYHVVGRTCRAEPASPPPPYPPPPRRAAPARTRDAKPAAGKDWPRVWQNLAPPKQLRPCVPELLLLPTIPLFGPCPRQPPINPSCMDGGSL